MECNFRILSLSFSNSLLVMGILAYHVLLQRSQDTP